jgi:hypothetical protein
MLFQLFNENTTTGISTLVGAPLPPLLANKKVKCEQVMCRSFNRAHLLGWSTGLTGLTSLGFHSPKL